MTPRTTAVVRFSSLGDVLLAAHVPSMLKRANPGERVLFVTKAHHASVLDGHPDIDGLVLLGTDDDTGDAPSTTPMLLRGTLPELAAALREAKVETMFDLHGNLRSAALRNAVRPSRLVRAPKHGLKRRLMVHAKWIPTRPLPPLLRGYRALVGLPADDPLKPWLRDALSARDRARAAEAREGLERGGYILYGVGARWATKRWPLEHFVSLAAAVRKEWGLEARFALSPGEPDQELARLLGADAHQAVTLDVRALAALAGDAAAIVSNDSGVLHLGPALGVPAVGLFGSTVPAFGFALQGPRDAVAEIPLSCRPCSVHGLGRCPLGHHACMQALTPDIVCHALRPILATVAAS
ncbi:MAG TPA: glycosyltransferase family 9 protein [Candidatus Eisenbacteria bacterium]|nr:glycosyltransferase family 9 protein [Candidatus Eisenbacteria bacterium]